MIMAKKGYIYPIKKKIPLIILLNLFGMVIISQISRFVNIFSENLSNYLPGSKKASLVLREVARHAVTEGL